MGLFSKKDPCAICGGKVKALFPYKIGGQLICNDCHGVTDLPDDAEKQMTIDDFREYMTFREENAQLKNQFEVTKKIDFGWFDTKFMFDFKNRLLCMDKNLNKTIFEGKQIRSFIIREDFSPLFEGDANGLRRYTSAVPSNAMALAPQINHYRMQQEMERERARRDGNDDSSYRPSMYFDIPEPFKQFVIEIQFEHPYWNNFQADMTGPTFNNEYPDLDDYLRSYKESATVMEDLAKALMKLAFPGAPEQLVNTVSGGTQYTTNTASAPVDAAGEIQRYKALMDQGILTEDEFNAKKRQLLGI